VHTKMKRMILLKAKNFVTVCERLSALQVGLISMTLVRNAWGLCVHSQRMLLAWNIADFFYPNINICY